MNDWLVDLFKEIIWEALVEFYTDIATWTEDKIETELKKLKDVVGAPKPLSSSPLVRVSDYNTTADPDVDHITFLVRGRVPLFKGVESVFMRVEVTVSTDIDLLSGDWPIEIIDWHTIVGDLKISKKNVFSANLGFGYDDGVWLGRGAVKILPADFGLDIYLGGLSDRGAMIGLSIDLPAPIPLGSSGLGLVGMGGDFAYNFIPRLEESGIPVTDPTAKHYVNWARDTEVLNRWEAGPIDQTAVGVGINTDLITLEDTNSSYTYAYTVDNSGDTFNVYASSVESDFDLNRVGLDRDQTNPTPFGTTAVMGEIASPRGDQANPFDDWEAVSGIPVVKQSAQDLQAIAPLGVILINRDLRRPH